MITKFIHKHILFFISAVLVTATLVAYEPVRNNGFLGYDDDIYVTENSHVSGGISFESIKWAFTTGHAGNWHPLTWLSHMLDYQLFGRNPAGHHIINLFFHIMNTLLLFWVFQRMTGAVWQSAFVAAAFALHPLHVESVAWVAERKDVLSTLFWMLTMAAYLSYVKRPSAGRYLLTLLAFALGLMAKPMLVTLPFVLLLLDYWPLVRFKKLQPCQSSRYEKASNWFLVVEKLPLFVIAMASSVITFIVQQEQGAMDALERLPLNIRMANVLTSYITYISKMIYPSHLAVLYPHQGRDFALWYVLVSLGILILVTIIALLLGRRKPYIFLGWFWYLGTLVPVIGFVQIGAQGMADRYTYVPSIGIFIIVAWGAAELAARRRYRRFILVVSAAVILVVWGMCTFLQLRYWKDNSTLFAHTLKVTRNNYIMHNNYGMVLLEQGQYEEAIKHFNETLRLRPTCFSAYNSLATVYIKQEKYNEAIECRIKSLAIEPNQPLIWYHLGLGYGAVGKYDQAIQSFNKALQLKPDLREARQGMAIALKLREKAKTNESIRKKEKEPW